MTAAIRQWQSSHVEFGQFYGVFLRPSDSLSVVCSSRVEIHYFTTV